MSLSNAIITSNALTAEISPHGAELQRLTTADGRALLWDGDPSVWSGRAPLLFPVIGMLNSGEYRFEGRSYAMPKHGFARHALFELVDLAEGAARFRLSATPETRAIYPFEFQLDIEFELTGHGLTMRAVIANLGGAAMPASFGFHPALRWPLPFGQARAAHRILFPEDEPAPVRRINADGLLTPDRETTPIVDRTFILRDALFEDDALIFDQLTSRSLSYGAPSGQQVQVAFEDFPTLGIWTKPGAPYVCIEPWHGSADPVGFAGDIRDKPGIFEVAGGGSRSFAMRIALEPASG